MIDRQIIKNRIAVNNGRARKLERDGVLDVNAWLALLEASDGFCPYCHQQYELMALVIDHITPLWNGGLNTITNVCPACPSCNRRRPENIKPRVTHEHQKHKQTAVYWTAQHERALQDAASVMKDRGIPCERNGKLNVAAVILYALTQLAKQK